MKPNRLDPHAVQIDAWVAESVSQRDIVARLRERGVTTSDSALSQWLSRRQRRLAVAAHEQRVLDTIARAQREMEGVEAAVPESDRTDALRTVTMLLRAILTRMSLRALSASEGLDDPDAERADAATESLGRLIGPVSVMLAKAIDAEKLKAAQGQLALDREKWDVARAKAEQADAAEQVTRSDASPEEKQRRYREIFGLA